MEFTIIDDPIQFVRRHPAMFFPRGEPSPLVCAECLAAEALALGGNEVVILRDAEWWAVGGADDWFLPGESAKDQFARLIPLPELGQNSTRVEVVIAAFAQDVSTLQRAELQHVLGESPHGDFVERVVNRKLVRAVFFRFPSAPAVE